MCHEDDLKVCKELTDLIESGYERLQAEKVEQEKTAEAERIARADGWTTYEAACRAGLPEVLRSYMDPFAQPSRAADWLNELVVTVSIPNLAPLRVRLLGGGGTTYHLADSKAFGDQAYQVPEVDEWEDEEHGVQVCFRFRNPFKFGADELDKALARAEMQEMHAVMAREALEKRKADARSHAQAARAEPQYQPLEESLNPNPDLAVIEVIRGWIHQEVTKQVPF